MIENLPKPLTKEETYQLFKEYKKGSKKAKEKLIMHNMRLVITIASKNSIFDSELNKDLISAGTIGLINAISHFDITCNNEFSTYAFPWIRNAITNELAKENKNNSLISLDITINSDEEKKQTTLLDMLISDDLPTEEIIIKKIDDPKTLKLMKKVFSRLSETNQKIILLYYGFYKNKHYTQQEISDLLGMSRTAVGVHLKKGLERLRIEIEKELTKEKIKKLQKIN